MSVTTLPFFRFSMAKTARCFSGGLISVCCVACCVLEELRDHPWPLARLAMVSPFVCSVGIPTQFRWMRVWCLGFYRQSKKFVVCPTGISYLLVGKKKATE